ncbi:hypothetical protein SCWH03_01590 [Streptomyces pacificus]|uniref:Uncharacterized protein n=1 Tax=Streptomyces pacificus TaxID=2705029 RepID=A0A6A0ANC5_9ACTN|nr:hypothetical protein SCWH03_01590 [Streptomyces pacificus]
MGESKAQDTEAADRLGSSEARQFLSRLSGAFGVDGVLMVQKHAPGPEGADLAPSSALHWPRCECGSAKCPGFKAPPIRPTGGLSGRVAEANARSRRGGL